MSTARRGALGLAALLCASLGGCLLTTSLDGFTSDGSAGGDAAFSDATSGDSANPDDGSRVDGGAVDGGGFCAKASSTLFLCADFDDGRFPAPFMLSMRSGGTVTLADDNVASPPHAVVLALPGVASGSPGAALLHALPSGTKDLTVELDALFEKIGGQNFDLIKLTGAGADLGFQANPGGSITWDEGYADPDASGGAGPTGLSVPTGWAHYVLTVRVAGATASAQLTVNGVAGTGRAFEAASLTASSSSIAIGDTGVSSPKTEWRVRIDNVTIDVR